MLRAQENVNKSPFKQLGQELPTPNTYRSADGSPGHEYWQQQADYKIKATLDEENHRLDGSETITYHNNSPNALRYLWVQLDQNVRAKNSDTYKIATNSVNDQMSARQMRSVMDPTFDGGHKIKAVKDSRGRGLPYTINNTMMRVDLPQPLESGDKYTFQIDWYYNIQDRDKMWGRGGYECFDGEDEDGNCLYTMAQWFPRMAVYDDINGWQNKQFLGRGEFALPFGDYEVEVTVPADHIVASTGMLQNPKDVLTVEQRDLLEESKTADDPVIIVSQEEAMEKEKSPVEKGNTKTWVYHAEDVRDFAWGSSRKFIWDAMGVKIGGKTVMAMSYYPKEANPLYEKYSTEVVAHTLEVYSKYTINYPYPKAISVEANNGMEYPMICFNYGRPEKDGTYSERIKYGMIGVIIHEVGHNFFPMIINSDERQWTWMDEGLNTFVQYLAEQEWERDYPFRRGPAYKIVDYMAGDKENIMPIMTNSESIPQFGNNAYGKPATALNILRETIMGRELFDYAFKEYARRWAFKHPSPADFFRTMEDASGVDLDWFWRGWFYSTDHVDLAIADVELYEIDSQNPEVEKKKQKAEREAQRPYITDIRNREAIEKTKMEEEPELRDFYNDYDPLDVTDADKAYYERYQASLDEETKSMVEKGKYFYQLEFKREGGLVMPIILEMEFEDGTTELKRIPAEIWRMGKETVTKVFPTQKKVKQFVLDPYRETADIDTSDNYFPRREETPSRFDLFKRQRRSRPNPMQQAGEGRPTEAGSDSDDK